MTLDEFNQFLASNCGVTKDIIDKAFDGEVLVVKSLFFQPYRSNSDPLFRAASIVTAPVCSSVLAAESALLSLFLAFKSVLNLVMMDTENAKEHFGNSIVFLVTLAITLFAVVASPLINTINLLFGGAATIFQGNEEDSPYRPVI